MATITGSSGNDRLSGTSSADLMRGFAGNATLEGGSGDGAIVAANYAAIDFIL